MAPGLWLDRAVSRTPLAGHEGKSGALLERVLMPDGRRLVVKRFTPGTDLLMAALGERVGPEYLAWRAGALDRAAPHVRHPVVDAWVEGDATVVVMHDLGDAALSWADRLDREECRRVMHRVAGFHAACADVRVEGLTPLADHLALFAPRRLQPHVGGGNPLPRLAMTGWDRFARDVDPQVARPVLRLLEDPRPLADALGRRPCTLVHGDLVTVNMAFEGDTLTLIDWALVSVAPGAVDVARFVAGCSQVVDASREEIITDYAEAVGPAYDETAMRLALLGGLVWLGWNKALDAAENPDPEKRERERADLEWWVEQGRLTLDANLL